MITDQSISRHVRLSSRVSVDLTLSRAGCVCEWDPEMPPHLTAKEERRYLAARNTCASELARLIDGNVIVGDLTRDQTGLTGMLVFYPDGRMERR
jgi:hypothetical protein